MFYGSRTSRDGLSLILIGLFAAGVYLLEVLSEVMLFVVRFLSVNAIPIGVLVSLGFIFFIYRIAKPTKGLPLSPARPGSNNIGRPIINSHGYVVLTNNELEHRHVAEVQLQRKLYANEVVHHLNGKRDDNRPENLCLMTRVKHETYHAWLKWRKEKNGFYPSLNEMRRTITEEYSGKLLG